MNILIRVLYKGTEVSLSDALERGYVKIVDSMIEAQSDTKLSMSSGLYDYNGNKLFENDIVQTNDGKKYEIKFDTGMFYLFSEKNSERIPLFVHKIRNVIDVEKC